MIKVIVHVDTDTGLTCITRCIPWARLVAASPPVPLEIAHPDIRSAEAFAAFADSAEWAESEVEFAHRVAAKIIPPDVPYHIADHDPALDGDRTFRNALVFIDGRFGHDLEKARAIHMDRIRWIRNAELARLDIDTIQAVGRGDTERRDAVEAQKQILRDIPQTFDLTRHATVEDLKTAWPDGLPKPA